MGCPFPKFTSQKSSGSAENRKLPSFIDISNEKSPHYEPEPEPRRSVVQIPLQPLPSSSALRPNTPILQNDQSLVQLHTPIYVAIRSYQTTNNTHISFEINDEMELIKEINSSELYVNHLRTSLSGIIPKDFVQLDIDTPLRLAIKDAGIIQRCLMQYNVPGAYLIRRSATAPNSFVLSISQFHEQRQAFYWHYLICINSSNKYFYFPKEDRLKDLFFSSFKQLINDEHLRNVIPLTDILPYSIEFKDELWKIPFDEINLQHKIGQGHFGEVYRATWNKNRQIIPIAVKKLHIRGVTSTVEREIEAMKKLTNLYIVTLYGVSEDPKTNEILMITELMENGDLKSWLKNLSHLPEYSTILRFAKGISNGMSYLEIRNYVHRDLACRNILLGPNANFVKIADFGLSTIVDTNDTDQRQKAQSGKLAVRWLAPELIDNYAAYSIKSDVWSFGILLIEIWLKGDDPYSEQIPAWIGPAVSSGHIHEKPTDCPDNFYEYIIHPCLKFNPKDRPSFAALRQSFEKWQY